MVYAYNFPYWDLKKKSILKPKKNRWLRIPENSKESSLIFLGDEIECYVCLKEGRGKSRINIGYFGCTALKYLICVLYLTSHITFSPLPVSALRCCIPGIQKDQNKTKKPADFNLQPYYQRQDLELSDWENVILSSPPHLIHTQTHTQFWLGKCHGRGRA